MTKVVCPDCHGTGVDNITPGCYGPCTTCGGYKRTKIGFFGGEHHERKNGSGYINVSNKPCSFCSGKGGNRDSVPVSPNDTPWVKTEMKNIWIPCNHCGGSGKEKI